MRTGLPIGKALLCVAVGACLGRYGVSPWVAVPLGVLAAAGVWRRPWRDVALAALLIGAGWVRWEAVWYSPVRDLATWTPVDVVGVVEERSELETSVELRIRGSVRPHSEDPGQVYGRVLARCPQELDTRVRYGSEVRVAGTLVQPSARRNPGGFDRTMYLDQRRAAATVIVRGAEDVQVVGVGGWPWQRALDRFRSRLFARFDQILEPPYNALFAGILLGERRSIPDEILQDFIDGGVVHILVISGANFALLAGIVLVFLRVLPTPLSIVYATTILVSVLFAMLVGFQPPVVRVGLVICLLLVARLLERGIDRYHVVGLSALLILLWHPPSLFHVGFQLSFGATLGIVHFVPAWQDRLSTVRLRLQQSAWGAFTSTWVLNVAMVTFAAQLVTAPIVAYHFQRFYPWSLPANVPVLVISGGLMVATLVTACAGLVWAPLGV